MMSDTKITIPTLTPSNGIVACLAGPGGTGKSFLALTMAISAATGTTLLPIFTPSKPRRVMALFGQDGFEWVTRRMRSITQLSRKTYHQMLSYTRLYGTTFAFSA